MFKAIIQVSHQDCGEWMNQELVKARALPIEKVYVWRDGKKPRWILISGFPIPETKEMVLYPLWKEDGHKQYKMSIEEYNKLVDLAEIKIWDTTKDRDFVETVSRIGQTIRENCKIKLA